MSEHLKPGNSQNHETRRQRIWRHFKYHVEAPFIMTLGLSAALVLGYGEGQRIIRGDFGKVTDPQEMTQLISGEFNVVSNPNNQPPIDSTGGWLIDLYMGTGFVSGSAMLGYGIYLRRATRDQA